MDANPKDIVQTFGACEKCWKCHAHNFQPVGGTDSLYSVMTAATILQVCFQKIIQAASLEEKKKTCLKW